MRIHSSEFLYSVVSRKNLPRDELPEVAFLGRSNVGKSSLINCLLRRRRLAQTSKSPGKTRTLNFYLVNGNLLFVDLPGYGYAQVSKSEHAAWQKMAEGYLAGRAPLRLALLLVDIRHKPSELDRQMMSWLAHKGTPTLVVATKADKISGSKRKRHAEEIRRELALPSATPLVPFSSRAGIGREPLLAHIAAAVS